MILYILYSALLTFGLLGISVYCFVNGAPTSGIPIIFMTFFSAMIMVHIIRRYQFERDRIRTLSQLDVIIVPKPTVFGRGRGLAQ